MLRRTVLLASALGAFAARPALASDARLRVVASFSILADLASLAAGEHADVLALAGPDVDPHAFSPSPADARRCAEADVLVMNGHGFDPWMEKLARSGGRKARLVLATQGVATIRARAAHSHVHSHGHSHGHGAVDPHAWQDASRAAQMVRAIGRGLGEARPAASPAIAAQAARAADELLALDSWISGLFAPIPKEKRRIFTSHDAFAYFGARYGVEFRAPRGVANEGEPSPADLARIIRDIRRENAKVVFLENISSPRVIEQVARESGARVGGRLYSDALSAADGPAATYQAMMRHNATLMRDAMVA